MNKQNSHLSKFYMRNFLKYSLLKIYDNAMCHENESENQFHFSHLHIFYRTNITLEKSPRVSRWLCSVRTLSFYCF